VKCGALCGGVLFRGHTVLRSFFWEVFLPNRSFSSQFKAERRKCYSFCVVNFEIQSPPHFCYAFCQQGCCKFEKRSGIFTVRAIPKSKKDTERIWGLAKKNCPTGTKFPENEKLDSSFGLSAKRCNLPHPKIRGCRGSLSVQSTCPYGKTSLKNLSFYPSPQAPPTEPGEGPEATTITCTVSMGTRKYGTSFQ